MNWLIRNYFGNLTRVIYGTLAMGALAVTLAVCASKLPVIIVVKMPIGLAIFCNLIAGIYIAIRSRKKPINKSELLQRLKTGDITTIQVLRQHGWLMFGALVIFFWIGWMIFGTLLILINLIWR
jgi:hypothetical protein